MAAICSLFVLSHPAGAVEVDSDAIAGRTQAAIADFRSAMKLEPDLQHGAEFLRHVQRAMPPVGLAPGTEAYRRSRVSMSRFWSSNSLTSAMIGVGASECGTSLHNTI
jgi:hypothetical protein